MVRRISLGRMAVFLLPSAKLEAQKHMRNQIHLFLMERYSGYTVSHGNTSGHWQDDQRRVYSAEHRVYHVSFVGKDRIPELENFLATVGRALGERYVYLETGEDAWLIDTAE